MSKKEDKGVLANKMSCLETIALGKKAIEFF